MHRFDYSFLDNGMLPAGLVNITADIYSLRVMAIDRRHQFEDVYTELAAIAKVQSVKSSNEIEGIVTTDERIREIALIRTGVYPAPVTVKAVQAQKHITPMTTAEWTAMALKGLEASRGEDLSSNA